MLGNNQKGKKGNKRNKSPNSYLGSGAHTDSNAHKSCLASCSPQSQPYCVESNLSGSSDDIIHNNNPNISRSTGSFDNLDADLLNKNSNGLGAPGKSDPSCADEYDSHNLHSNASEHSDDVTHNNNPNISRSTSISSIQATLESEDSLLEESDSIEVPPAHDTLSSNDDKINNSYSRDEHTAKKRSILTSLKEKMHTIWTAIYNYLKPFFESIYNKFIGKKKDIKNDPSSSSEDDSNTREKDPSNLSQNNTSGSNTVLSRIKSIFFSSTACSKNKCDDKNTPRNNN